MRGRILAGIETEYGLLVEGRSAEDQVDDAAALVRAYPGKCFPGWDYRFESPRADLRGFTLERLSVDPEDAKFDAGRAPARDSEVRSDRVLPNGARLYNDHGHPEYSTPECFSIEELALHDKAGEVAVLRAAEAYAASSGRETRLYKNNTDYHGASYGTHESYLVPRELGFERLYRALTPMLIARQVLCGAGKSGSEHGPPARFQLSQRADFFTEPASADTLYRRPVFNTRDEPHADPRRWIRVHVISGDANLMASCTARKVGLVKIALELCARGEAPSWSIADPVRAFQEVSRDESRRYRIGLAGGNWTSAYDVLDSYLCAYDAVVPEGEADPELLELVRECQRLMGLVKEGSPEAARSIDWLAKRSMLEEYMASEGTDWSNPSLASFDLEYHNVDPGEGLYWALVESGAADQAPDQEALFARLEGVFEATRARARGIAVSRFSDRLLGASWGSLTFRGGESPIDVLLPPDREYPAQLGEAADVESFIQILRGA